MRNILFDITPLAEGVNNSVNRTGIYFCTRNILKELAQRDNISIDFYCASKVISTAECELKSILSTEVNVINKNRINMILSTIWCDVNKKRIRYKSAKKILKNDLFSFLEIVIEQAMLFIDKCCEIQLDKYMFFLSTKYQAPKKIYKNKTILKMIVLHDAIAIIHPEFFQVKFAKLRTSWMQHMINTMNNEEIYLTNSNYTKNDFMNCCPNIKEGNFKVAYHACSDSFKKCTDDNIIASAKTKYGIDLNKKYLFSLCAIEPRKNIIRIVKCFIKFVQKNNIDDMIMVIGGKAWNNFILEFEKKMGYNINEIPYVKAIGYVDDADLPALYSGAEWFVYTSQYEGFGVPPLEAMSCGCPVIVSNNSSLPEVVGDAGILIDWDSDDQHIEAFEKYYYNSEMRKENSEKGLVQAQKFSWNKCVTQILEFAYERIGV